MKSFAIIIMTVILTCASAYAFSPSIVVQMAQHDSDRDALRESTFILENGVLDVFFDAGYVVSSLPTSINTDIAQLIKETTSIAKAGYMSYVVYISVYYHSFNNSTDETVSLDDIESVHWKVISSSDMTVVGEGEAHITKRILGVNDLVAMRNFSNDLGSQIKGEFDKIL